MSIHTDKARKVAASKGGQAGRHENRDLWDWSKRELIECALHLAALSTGEYDLALEGERARWRLIKERDALRSQGII